MKSYYQVNIVEGTSSSYPEIYYSWKFKTLAEARRKIKELEKDLSPTEGIMLAKFNKDGFGIGVDWDKNID